MKIDLLERKHLRLCAGVFIVAFSHPPWNEIWELSSASERLNTCYEMPTFYGLVAIENGAVLGFAMGFIERWYEGYHYCLKELCVDTSRQRGGVGRSLVNALQETLPSKGVEMIYFSTVGNSSAEAFYTQCGFSRSSELVVMTSNSE